MKIRRHLFYGLKNRFIIVLLQLLQLPVRSLESAEILIESHVGGVESRARILLRPIEPFLLEKFGIVLNLFERHTRLGETIPLAFLQFRRVSFEPAQRLMVLNHRIWNSPRFLSQPRVRVGWTARRPNWASLDGTGEKDCQASNY